MNTQPYDISDNLNNLLETVVASSATEALARSAYAGRHDVWAVPSRYRPATQPQPSSGYAYPPAPPSPVQQVVSLSQPESRRRCPHLLHFVLTILTAGLWLPVWIIDALISGRNK